jgi:ubiquinone/menaquinone biosynthesis C-methylase UbiE
MGIVDLFKKFFEGAELEVEDLYLLEAFQLTYWPGWAPERELAAVLWGNPAIKRFLLKKCPEISDFIEGAQKKYRPASSPEELAECEDTLVWTIADLLVYNKCPEVYDGLAFHNWDFKEVTRITPLDGKTLVEGGAGTGQVTFHLADYAASVFAIEPVTRLRDFIRDKAKAAGLKNIFVLDGFLHAIPLPDNFAEVLVTSHALGWHLEDELLEFERVVRPGGYIIHCPGTALSSGEDDPTHQALVSPKWAYAVAEYLEPDGPKRKYWKQVG